MKPDVYAMGQSAGRRVVLRFKSEKISTEGCLNLISEVERRSGMLRRIDLKIKDDRVKCYVKHRLLDLFRLRVFLYMF